MQAPAFATWTQRALKATAAGGGDDQKKRFDLVGSKYPGAETTIVTVPGASNFISAKMVLASINAGSSTEASNSILQLLSKRNPKLLVAVTREDDGLTAATLKRALVDGKGKISGSWAVFVDSPDYNESLSKAAADAGVRLEFIPYP